MGAEWTRREVLRGGTAVVGAAVLGPAVAFDEQGPWPCTREARERYVKIIQVPVPHLSIDWWGSEDPNPIWTVLWGCRCGMDVVTTGWVPSGLGHPELNDEVIRLLLRDAKEQMATLGPCPDCGEGLELDHYDHVVDRATVRAFGKTLRGGSIRIPGYGDES